LNLTRRLTAADNQGMKWEPDAPPTLSAAERRLAELTAERETLQEYIDALKKLTSARVEALAGESNSSTDDAYVPPTAGAHVEATGDVVWAIMSETEVPLPINAILKRARKFPNWKCTADDRRERDRLSAALRRGKRNGEYVQTKEGWMPK